MEFEVCVFRSSGTASWGIEFGEREDDDSVRIRSVVPGTAAATAVPALKENDIVTGVNGRGTRHLTFDALIDVFREVLGTRLLLQVERNVGQNSEYYSTAPYTTRPWSARDEFLVDVVPNRLYAVRGGALERLAQLAAKNLGHATELLGQRTRYVRCWDLATEMQTDVLRMAIFGPRERGVLDRRTLSRVDGRVPGLRDLVAVGAAVGAWLSLDSSHVAIIGDSSGARLRVAMACVAALRIGGLVDDSCAKKMTDSSLEAYDAFIQSADLQSALPLASLPPSFKRALSHLDAAIACRDPPNPHPLFLRRVRAPAVFDFPLRLDVRQTCHHRKGNAILQEVNDDEAPEYLLMADIGENLEDDFAITFLRDDDPVLRFASNTAFLGPGRVSLPKTALDVFPKWREKLPPDFAVIFYLDEISSGTSSALVPHDRKAILALGLEVLTSDTPSTNFLQRTTPVRTTPPQQRPSSSHSPEGGGFNIATTPTFVQPPS